MSLAKITFGFLISITLIVSTIQSQCLPEYSPTGEAAANGFGYSVSNAGDVDNDGYDDFIVGAYGNDAGGSNAGRAYVYSGQTGLILHTFTGAAAEYRFGSSVSGAGDVNNDGYDDIIIGAHSALNNTGWGNSGRAYVYSGQTWELLYEYIGGASNFLGKSVSSAGDLNNDGYDDFIIGAYSTSTGGMDYNGMVYVHSGQTGAILHTWTGEASFDKFGNSVYGVHVKSCVNCFFKQRVFRFDSS